MFSLTVILLWRWREDRVVLHEPGLLEPGLTLEMESPPEVDHRYRFRAQTGGFIAIYLEQRGADLRLALHTPSGENSYERDSRNAEHGGEFICLIAEETGSYVLEVVAGDPSRKGTYNLRLTIVERAGDVEHTRARAFAEYRQAIAAREKYEQALEAKEDSGGEESLLSILQGLERSRRLWEKNDDVEQVALILLEEAALWHDLNQTDRQKDCLEEAARRFESLGQQPTAGLVQHYLGAFFYRRSRLDKAMDAYNRALEFRFEPNRDRAATLIELALVNLVLGNLNVCRSYLEEAEQIYINLKDINGLTNLFLQRGRLRIRMEQWDAAIRAFEKGLAFLAGSEDPLQLTILDELGRVLARGDEHEVKRALEVYDEIDTLLKRIHFPSEEWSIRLQANRAEVLLSLGRYREALERLKPTLAFFEQSEQHKEQQHILFNLARASRGLGKLHEALVHMEKVLTISDRLRSQTPSQGIRAALISSHYFYVDFYLELLMQLREEKPGYVEYAFLRLEQFRAYNQVESLQRGAAPFEDKKNRELADHVLNLRKTIATLTWQNHRGNGQGEGDRRLALLIREHEQALNVLQARQPAPSPPQLDLAQMRQLLDPQTVLLFYALGETNCWLWILDLDQLKVFKLGSRTSIEADAREYFNLIKHPDQYRFLDRVTDLGEELSQRLLAPVAELVVGKRLQIMGDGILNCLPFGALPHPKNDGFTVTEKHEIVYLPSMRSLALLRRRAATRKPADGGMVIFAAPAFHKKSAFPQLAGSLREAEAIADLAPGRPKIYKDFFANKQAVLNGACEQARYLHFGTHGVLNLNHSELSALVLATSGPEDEYIDGFLSGYEIRQCRFTAELVVLGACRSALGRNYRGEGLVGLAHSFLEAGAQGVVVSLWDVEDRASEKMMTLFYEHFFTQGKGAAAALRHAQTEMRKSKRWGAPFYWASFVFVGDWQIPDR